MFIMFIQLLSKLIKEINYKSKFAVAISDIYSRFIQVYQKSLYILQHEKYCDVTGIEI